MSVAQRFRNFLIRAQWMETFIPGRLAAICSMVRARHDPLMPLNGAYGSYEISFRGCDFSALKEVLVDEEYYFLTGALHESGAPVVLDIGAHIGLFSLWALTVNPASRITSVEASPSTFDILKRNVSQANKADWTVINRAAWKNDETLRFAEAKDSMSHKVSATGGLEVQGISLADLTKGMGDIDLMKVDIEGAEEAFFCADPHALSSVKRLVVELHPQLCDTQRVRETLQQFFPQIDEIQGRKSSKPLLYCRKEGISL